MYASSEINDSYSQWQRICVFNLPNERSYSRFSRNLEDEEVLNQTFNVDFTVNEEVKNHLSHFIDTQFWIDAIRIDFEVIPDYTNFIPSSYAYDFAQIFITRKNYIGIVEIDEERELKISVVSKFIDLKEIVAIYVSSYLEEFIFSIVLSNQTADEELLNKAFEKELLLHDLFPNMFFSFRYIPSSLVSKNECVPGSSELIFEREDVGL